MLGSKSGSVHTVFNTLSPMDIAKFHENTDKHPRYPMITDEFQRTPQNSYSM
jgi:hypothetical protein